MCRQSCLDKVEQRRISQQVEKGVRIRRFGNSPHLTTLSAEEASSGWLLVCSDGLWNYCSAPEDMRVLVHNMVEQVSGGPAGADRDPDPAAVAQALVDFANEQGGRDNITVALARLAGQDLEETTGVVVAAPEEGDPIDG